MAIDFEAEGLLGELEGEEREARLRLLAELADDGVELGDLRRAVDEDRLVLLPAERALRGPGRRLDREEMADESGLSLEFLERLWRAMGMPDPGPGVAAYTDEDLEAVERARQLIEAGVPESGILEVSRALGISMSQLAAAMRQIGIEAFAEGASSEYELGMRFSGVLRDLIPVFVPILEYALRLHVHQQISTDYVDRAQIADGRLAGGSTVAVCFADLVDFTKLGERLDAAEIGALTERLEELAADAVRGRVRFVKSIGDAVMLTAPEAPELAESALALLDCAARQGEDFPELRVGIAMGEALARGGDLFGRPVNLASRITAIARPGSILCSEPVHDALASDERFSLSFARKREIKGLDRSQKLFRLRAAGDEDD